jgi:hypothetical protein
LAGLRTDEEEEGASWRELSEMAWRASSRLGNRPPFGVMDREEGEALPKLPFAAKSSPWPSAFPSLL